MNEDMDVVQNNSSFDIFMCRLERAEDTLFLSGTGFVNRNAVSVRYRSDKTVEIYALDAVGNVSVCHYFKSKSSVRVKDLSGYRDMNVRTLQTRFVNPHEIFGIVFEFGLMKVVPNPEEGTLRFDLYECENTSNPGGLDSLVQTDSYVLYNFGMRGSRFIAFGGYEGNQPEHDRYGFPYHKRWVYDVEQKKVLAFEVSTDGQASWRAASIDEFKKVEQYFSVHVAEEWDPARVKRSGCVYSHEIPEWARSYIHPNIPRTHKTDDWRNSSYYYK